MASHGGAMRVEVELLEDGVVPVGIPQLVGSDGVFFWGGGEDF